MCNIGNEFVWRRISKGFILVLCFLASRRETVKRERWGLSLSLSRSAAACECDELSDDSHLTQADRWIFWIIFDDFISHDVHVIHRTCNFVAQDVDICRKAYCRPGYLISKSSLTVRGFPFPPFHIYSKPCKILFAL